MNFVSIWQPPGNCKNCFWGGKKAGLFNQLSQEHPIKWIWRIWCKTLNGFVEHNNTCNKLKVSSKLPLPLSKGPGKRGHIVADTLLPMMFAHKMFLNKIRNIFCVRNKCCARGQTGKQLLRQQCVRDNVSSFARALSSEKNTSLEMQEISQWSFPLGCVELV